MAAITIKATASTLFMFTGDQGAQFPFSKWNLYDAGIRVPLMVAWPGHVKPGTTTKAMVSLIDLLPTMMEAAGIPLPAGAPALDGQSLLKAGTRTTMYGEYYNDPANPNIPSWRMVRQGNIKFIRTFNANGAVVSSEYYNLTTDPAENTNLLGDTNQANNPTQTQLNALVAKLNAFATCSGAACIN